MNKTSDLQDEWQKSRRGAWAARGFHYQHLVTVLLIVRQWLGQLPPSDTVPEGLDDCVLEHSDSVTWVQIKSRLEGAFRSNEADAILEKGNAKLRKLQLENGARSVVVFEQNVVGRNLGELEDLESRTNDPLYRCQAPEDEAIQLISGALGCLEMVSEAILYDLYQLVAETAASNASRNYADRIRISVTHIEARIQNRLLATDSTSIEKAILSGTLNVLDFNEAIDEPGFYYGVKTKPGHIAAGLAVGRSQDSEVTKRALLTDRRLLLSGPSGAGKSALLWLTVQGLSGRITWYEVSPEIDASSVTAIMSLIKARRPSETRPFGLAFDEVSHRNFDAWNALADAVLATPHTYIVGAVRQEDYALIRNRGDIPRFDVQLTEELAEAIWNRLHGSGATKWSHWREAFEISDGLTLEYTHILTAGDRLSAVIADQVNLREQEKRDTELAIVRTVSTATQYGGEVRVDRLFESLNISKENGARCLRRLLDEHLVREASPGVLGGLHALRSQALASSSHDEIVFRSDESLWAAVESLTPETISGVLRGVFQTVNSNQEAFHLTKAASVLSKSHDPVFWAGILTGLGLVTTDRAARRFIACLEDRGVQRAQWNLASLFVLSGGGASGLPGFEALDAINQAIADFRAHPIDDLRQRCLDKFSEGIEAPVCTTLNEANLLLSCMVPIAHGEPLTLTFVPSLNAKTEIPINDLSETLATAYAISSKLAQTIVDAFGGEPRVLSCFADQTPWVSIPEILEDGQHGLTIHANYFQLIEHVQAPLEKSIPAVCETLLALVPRAEAASCTVVRPDGSPYLVLGMDIWSKNMPRENLPSKAQVAWNRAFRQLVLSHAQTITLTEYASRFRNLVVRTEKVFRLFTERWVSGKLSPVADRVADEVNAIDHEVNNLAYYYVGLPNGLLNKPAEQDVDADLLGPLLTDILKNIPRRAMRIELNAATKAEATFAAELASRCREQRQSDIWRAHSDPPLDALRALEERLGDLSALLHDWHLTLNKEKVSEVQATTKRAALNRKLRSVAFVAKQRAQERLNDTVDELISRLLKVGYQARCITRPVDRANAPYWPAVELAIVISVGSFEGLATYVDACLPIAKEVVGDQWSFRLVPQVENRFFTSMAIAPTMDTVVPDTEFRSRWERHLDGPIADTPLADKLEAGLNACDQISAVLCALTFDRLHPDEDRAMGTLNDTYHDAQHALDMAIASFPEADEIAFAGEVLRDQYALVGNELVAIREGGRPKAWMWEDVFAAANGADPSANLVQRGISIIQIREMEARLNLARD
ncbi:hypothetical protein RMQ97_13335 [Maricaulis sp. D1M11]|uniref:hypothetical protein n=1 Tax=Maricaulis sp. D1M11 TaxID=3076117 RepID=UPI0039B3AE2E